jgi:hypothetical protein
LKFSDFGGVPVLKEISIWRFVIERDGIIVINIIINALENNQPNDRANGSSESNIHVRRPSVFVGQNDINVFNHAASRCHSHSVIDRFSIWDRKRRTESPSKIGVAQNGVDVFKHGASRCHSHNVFEDVAPQSSGISRGGLMGPPKSEPNAELEARSKAKIMAVNA